MRTISIIFIVFLLLWFVFEIDRIPLIFQSPEEAYADFLDTTNQAEDMLMDPLILAGKNVVPLIIQETQNPKMELRRYAIHFLGNGKFVEAIPVLESILINENELDYFRGDALASIFNIDPDLGLSLAKEYSFREDYLGNKAQEITTGENYYWVQRSFWEAFNNLHH